MEINIEWDRPYKIKIGDVINWRRTWCIPEQFRSSFFDFWRECKYGLLSDGFRVYKKDDDWYLSETKLVQSQFKTIGTTKKYIIPSLSNFILPNYNIKDNSGLRPWQIPAAGKLVSAINHWGAGVDSSELGVGKTYTACGVARELGSKIVVVCPKAVISSWNDVVKNHFKLEKSLISVINYEQLKIGKSSSPIASFVTPRGHKRKIFKWKVPKDTLIIWDEAQKLKNWKTKNSKTCIAAFKAGYKQLFCSATIATNPLELRTIGTCLKLFKDNQESWYQFLREHGCTNGNWGMEFTPNEKIRKKVLTKLHKDMFIDRGVRLRRDSIPNFPECDLFVVLLDMGKEDTEKINSIYREMSTELKKLEELKKLNNRDHLVIELRYRQQIELIKVPLFIEMIEEAREEGFSVVIFVNFSDTIKALSDRLNTKCIFDGIVGDDIREINKQRFQNNEEPEIIVSVKAGGGGLGLHDIHGGHPRLALISPSYSAVDMRQVLGRIWRDAAKTKGVQKLVCVSDTVEEKVYNNIMKKLNNLDLLNDGDLSYSVPYEVVNK